MNIVKITRRQFLKWLSASAAAIGLSQTDLLKIEKALAASPTPDPNSPVAPLGRVIWIAGAACSGCPTSLLNYKANPDDPETVLNAIAKNALGLWVDIEQYYPVQWPGGTDNDIDIAEVVLEVITIDYAQIVMAASGDVPNKYLKTLTEDPDYKYVLLVEGTIQTAANGKYCRIMDLPWSLPAGIYDTAPGGPYVTRNASRLNSTDVTMAGGTLWLADNPNCLAVVTLGTCASYGGVPAASGSVTGGKGAYEWIKQDNNINHVVPGLENFGAIFPLVVNVPGCPPNPDWFMATVGAALLEIHATLLQDLGEELNAALTGILLNNLDTSLDHNGRPKLTYTGIYHDASDYVFCRDCPRRDLGYAATLPEAAKNSTNPGGKCMQQVGCMGALAGPASVRADCPVRKWNNFEDHSKNNWCVQNNMPCQGCTDPGFPDKCSPFYSASKDGI